MSGGRTGAPRGIRSIRAKLLLTMMPIVIVALIVMSVIAISKVTSAQEHSVSQSVAAANATQAEKFNSQMQNRAGMANALAQVGADLIGHADRQTVMQIEYDLTKAHPELMGAYINYTPNQFDHDDAAWIGKPGMGPKGDFGPYWNRLKGKLTLGYGMGGWQTAGWFQIPAKTRRVAFIEPYLWLGQMFSSTIAPVIHNGKVVGMAGVDVVLGQLEQEINRLRVLQTGYSFVVSHDGLLVTYPKKKLVGKETLDQLAKREHAPAFATIAKDVKAGKSGSLTTIDPLTGKQVKLFYSPVSSGDWGFISVAPTAEILASAHSLRNTLILVAIIIVLIVAAVLAFVATKIAAPAARVRDAARRISNGELDVEINANSADEIGQVAGSFREIVTYMSELAGAADQIADGRLDVEVKPRSPRDRLGSAIAQMRSQIEQLIRRIQTSAGAVASSSTEMAATSKQLVATSEELVGTSDTLVTTADELVSTSGELTSTSGEIVASSELMADTSGQLATASAATSAAADQTGNAIGEVARAIEDIAQGAERQAKSAETARNQTESMVELAGSSVQTAQETAQITAAATEVAAAGVDAATRASEAMASVRAASEAASTAIHALGVKSEQVGGIIATITGIAEQTNLLALNAAIEAARAGEHGRGFAVVADEVRNLAEESRGAAQSIAALITAIQDDTQRTIDSVEGATKATAGGARTVEEAHTAFVRIGDSVAEVKSRTDEIIAAIERLAAAARGVAHEINETTAVAEQASAATQQISASTEEVSASAQESSASTAELSASTQQLSASAQQVNASAQQIAASARLTSESAQRTSTSARQTSGSAQQTSASAQQIAVSADELSRISGELRELVEQFTLSGV